MLDNVTAEIDDPAEVYASSVRITARIPTTHPQLAKIIQRTGLRYLNAPGGLAPRALRIKNERAMPAASIDDPALALACSGGAVLGVLALGTPNLKAGNHRGRRRARGQPAAHVRPARRRGARDRPPAATQAVESAEQRVLPGAGWPASVAGQRILLTGCGIPLCAGPADPVVPHRQLRRALRDARRPTSCYEPSAPMEGLTLAGP